MVMNSLKTSANNFLTWEDIIVVTNDGSRNKLLNGLTGYAKPNRIMAIMGPSGSGKTTLLDALAGRLPSNVNMTGNVLMHGRKTSMHQNHVCYVSQQDVFLGTLTVRETLAYSADLRLPTTMTKPERDGIVEDTIIKMGLQSCADNKIGNWHFRGISSGEKRRLTISIQLLTKPRLLFLDEPTSSLDSAAAFYVIHNLTNFANDGSIILCSIHQPSIEVFHLFDDLFLLSGGETVYFGELKNALKFFAEAGFPCPTKKNPPDHYLRCITTDFDKVDAATRLAKSDPGTPSASSSSNNMTTLQMKETLVNRYNYSKYAANARKTIQEISLIEDVTTSNISHPTPIWRRQLWTLIRRSSLNILRDFGYYWLRLFFYVMVAVSAGTLFFDIGTGPFANISRGKCFSFLVGNMICLSIGGLPFFTEEIKVSNRERSSKYYGAGVYVISNFISQFPYVVAISVSSGTILYHTVKLHPGFSNYLYFSITLFFFIALTETTNLIVAALIYNPVTNIGISAGVSVFMMMASNMSRTVSDLPIIFWQYPMAYISFTRWGLQGLYKNDMIGLEFEPLFPGEPKLKGEMLLQTRYGIDPNVSKWWDVMALMVSIICYRLVFYVILRNMEQASSIFHTSTQKLFHK